MVHANPLQHRILIAAASLLLMAGATRVSAAQPNVVWVDNDSFAFSSCASTAPLEALSSDEDPTLLMDAFRLRGIFDAGQLVRTRGASAATIMLTPVSGSLRCGDMPPVVVFRVSSFDRTTGRGWSTQMVTKVQGFPGGTARASNSD